MGLAAWAVAESTPAGAGRIASLPARIQTSNGATMVRYTRRVLHGPVRRLSRRSGPSVGRGLHIDQTEVTNARYAAFLKALRRRTAPLITAHATRMNPRARTCRRAVEAGRPGSRGGRGLVDAYAYAAWAKRLPGSQWEKAAMVPVNAGAARPFPGRRVVGRRVVRSCESRRRAAYRGAVGSIRPARPRPLDLAGNVWGLLRTATAAITTATAAAESDRPDRLSPREPGRSCTGGPC